MSRLAVIKSALARIVRARSSVQFGDLLRTVPVSSTFGLDRGTPIDRYYIDKFIRANAQVLAGRTLEVGQLRYSKLYGTNITEKSILALKAGVAKADSEVHRILIADLTDTSKLNESQFDCFLCTQTLQFIYDVQAGVEGAHRLLAPGGTFVGTVPGISQISRYDMDRWGDYWRFTTRSLERAIQDVFGYDVQVQNFGNVMAAQAFLLGLAVEDLEKPDLLDIVDDNYQVIIGFRATKR